METIRVRVRLFLRTSTNEISTKGTHSVNSCRCTTSSRQATLRIEFEANKAFSLEVRPFYPRLPSMKPTIMYTQIVSAQTSTASALSECDQSAKGRLRSM